jgi:sRNA-binding protein
MGPHPTARRHKVVVKTFADLKSVPAPAKPAPPAPITSIKVTAKPPTVPQPPPPAKSPVKAGLNAKQRKRALARRGAAEWLRASFPALFGCWPPRPLAIGIGQAITEAGAAAGFERSHVGAAMRFRVYSRGYLEALAADGSMRHGLDGAPVEAVAEEHKIEARKQMAELDARRAEARAAYIAAKRAAKAGGIPLIGRRG